MQKLFQALAMHYEFSLSEEAQAAAPAAPVCTDPAVRAGDESAVTLWAALLPLTALLMALTIGRKSA